MADKQLRMYDLLVKIDMSPVESYVDLRRDYLLKDEITEICNILKVDVGEDSTKANMRESIRSEAINPFAKKKPTSEFSTSEIRSLSWAIDREQYLDPDDIEDFEPETGMGVVVNGEAYTITRCRGGTAHVNAAYDRYECLNFGKRKRLMILHGRDPDKCHYHASVILEYAADYGPYKRWKKSEYVKTLLAT